MPLTEEKCDFSFRIPMRGRVNVSLPGRGYESVCMKPSVSGARAPPFQHGLLSPGMAPSPLARSEYVEHREQARAGMSRDPGLNLP